MKRKTILLFGHYGVPNWGDEAILSGILSQIDIKKFRIIVVTDNIQFTQTHHGVKAIYPPPFGIRSLLRGKIFQFFTELKRANYVIFGGGGLFQEAPQKAFQIWYFYFLLVRFFQKKVFILGNSFEPLKNKKNEKKLQKILDYIKFCSVRESESAKYLQMISPSKKVIESTDGAYFLPEYGGRGRRFGILLSFREGELSLDEEMKILAFLQQNFPKEFDKKEVSVLVMQSKNSQDENFALRHNFSVFSPNSLHELREKIKKSRFVFTTRLHAGILASLSYTPFFALSTRSKIFQFFGKEFSCPLHEFFSKKEQVKRVKIFQNLSYEKEKIKIFVKKQKKKLSGFFPEFFLV